VELRHCQNNQARLEDAHAVGCTSLNPSESRVSSILGI